MDAILTNSNSSQKSYQMNLKYKLFSTSISNVKKFRNGGYMQTLHDFFVATKGTEYLIAITFLVIFPAFWVLLSKKKKAKQDTKTSQD